jgi:hypothetical protein
MKRWKVTRGILLVVAAACLVGFTPVQAKKPDNPGGGGDAVDTLEYDIHQLDSAGGAFTVRTSLIEVLAMSRREPGRLCAVLLCSASERGPPRLTHRTDSARFSVFRATTGHTVRCSGSVAMTR